MSGFEQTFSDNILISTAQAENSKYSFQITEATISSVHTAIQSHQLTCVELINAYLKRIQHYNLSLANGAPINAFTSLNPNMLSKRQR